MAGAPIAVEYVAIRADSKNFKQDVERDVTPTVSKLSSSLAALGVGAAVGTFLKSGLDELKQQQEVAAQTQARLVATGGAANVTAKQVAELADREQALSGKDAELIQSGANLLLTFKSIRNEVGAGNDIFNQANQAALDLSVAGFGTLESTSVQLGKALESPAQGLTALRRVGVTFSTEQVNLIKQLDATGDKLQAQKVLLKAVEDQVGGAAEAYGNTLSGKIELAKNKLDDLAANAVAKYAPSVEFIAGAISKVSDAVNSIPGTGGGNGVTDFLTTITDPTMISQLTAVADGLYKVTHQSDNGIVTFQQLNEKTQASKEDMLAWNKSLEENGTTFDKDSDAIAAFTAWIRTQRAAAGQAAATTGELTDATISLADAQAAATKRADNLYTATTGLLDAHQSEKAAAQGVASAQKGIDEARKDGVQALRDQRTAALDLADAQKALQEIERRGAADQRDVAGARIDARTAVLDVAAAERSLAETLADPLATAEDRERAQLALERARLRVADSTDAVGEAERRAAGRGEELARASDAVTAAQQRVRDAHDESRAATEKMTVAQDQLAAAYLNQAKVAVTVAEIQATIADTTLTSAQKADILRDSLDKLAGTLSPDNPLRNNLAGFIADLAAIPITGVDSGDRSAPGAGGLTSRRSAAGGPVGAGGSTQIDENGPEMFTDSYGRQYLTSPVGGQVTPARRATGQQGAGMKWSPTIIVNGVKDPEPTARAVSSRLRELMYLTGAR